MPDRCPYLVSFVVLITDIELAWSYEQWEHREGSRLVEESRKRTGDTGENIGFSFQGLSQAAGKAKARNACYMTEDIKWSIILQQDIRLHSSSVHVELKSWVSSLNSSFLYINFLRLDSTRHRILLAVTYLLLTRSIYDRIHALWVPLSRLALSNSHVWAQFHVETSRIPIRNTVQEYKNKKARGFPTVVIPSSLTSRWSMSVYFDLENSYLMFPSIIKH